MKTNLVKKNRLVPTAVWGALSLIVLSFFVPVFGYSQDAAPATGLPQDVANIIWLCLTAFLVFFMQAGFAMVESGMTRAKNAVNIMMKNLLDFCFGAILFWATGYAIMYSSGDANIFGFDSALAFLGSANAPTDSTGYGISAAWLFQVVFAATAATIVSGAIAKEQSSSRTLFIPVSFRLLSTR